MCLFKKHILLQAIKWKKLLVKKEFKDIIVLTFISLSQLGYYQVLNDFRLLEEKLLLEYEKVKNLWFFHLSNYMFSSL